MQNGRVPNAKWDIGLTRIGRVSCISQSRNPGMSEAEETLRPRVQLSCCKWMAA